MNFGSRLLDRLVFAVLIMMACEASMARVLGNFAGLTYLHAAVEDLLTAGPSGSPFWRAVPARMESEAGGMTARSWDWAVAIQPDDPVILRGFARFLCRQGRSHEATLVAKEAGIISPKVSVTGWVLASALWLDGNPVAARQTLKSYGLRDPLVNRMTQQAQNEFDHGAIESSMYALDRLSEIQPDDVYAFFLRARCLEKLGDLSPAVEYYLAAARSADDTQWVKGAGYANAGRLLRLRLTRLAEAVDCYRKAVQVDPTDRWSYVALGSLLAEQGRDAEAMDAFARARPLAIAYHLLGVGSMKRGDMEQAILNFRQAVEGEPNTNYLFDLAEAYHQDLQLGMARETLRKILRVDPENLPARQKLGAWGEK